MAKDVSILRRERKYVAHAKAKSILGGKRKKRSQSSLRISEKIPVLMREGKTQKQAVGEAYGMERAGRLRRGGVYVPVKK